MVVAERSNESEITEQDLLLEYKRLVDLPADMIIGESNQTTVLRISDEDGPGKKLMNTDVSRAKKELKYLRGLRMAVIYMMMCVLNLYEYAKKNSGPLGSTQWTVEVVVMTIVGPVYRRFKAVPDDFLVLLDTEIDKAADKFDKQVMYLGLGSIQKAVAKTQALVNAANLGCNLHTAVHSAATEYRQFFFNQSMKFWVGLEYQCPPIQTLAEKAIPVAAYLSEKYNQVVRDLTLKDYAVFGYLPLVPMDGISTALNKRARQKI